MSLWDEYLGYYTSSMATYGERTCVLMQVGSFYEVSMMKDADGSAVGNADTVAKLLNIVITKKGRADGLYMAGFPTVSLPKFLPVLLEANFTVVVVDQHGDGAIVKRKIAGVYSASIKPVDMIDEASNLTHVCVEMMARNKTTTNVLYSVCNINTLTNEVRVVERGIVLGLNDSMDLLLDDMYKCMLQFQSTEIMCTVMHQDAMASPLSHEALTRYLGLGTTPLHFRTVNTSNDKDYKTMVRPSYINEFLKKVYRHVDFGLLEPIEYFGLAQHQLSCLALVYSIEFIKSHNERYMQHLSPPVMLAEEDHLVMEMNTLAQLNVLPLRGVSGKNTSLLWVVDHTATASGRRALKQRVAQPFRHADVIAKHIDLTRAMQRAPDDATCALRKILEDIPDMDRLHRKMSMGALLPRELAAIYDAYTAVLQVHAWTTSSLDARDACVQNLLEGFPKHDVETFLRDIHATYSIESLARYTDDATVVAECPLKKGVAENIDALSERLQEVSNGIEDIRCRFDAELSSHLGKTGGPFVKTYYTDTDGHVLLTTKIRGQMLQKKACPGVAFVTTTNTCKIIPTDLTQMSSEYQSIRACFKQRFKQHYEDVTDSWYRRYADSFQKAVVFVSDIDIARSNVHLVRKAGYCLPEVVAGTESFVQAHAMRHPIIERVLSDTTYVPNDVRLDAETHGVVLYSLNSCGKSSLLRSIGLAVVLAQSGLPVPCTAFRFCPFHRIVTQVDMYDNLWKNQSSFVSEMIGLRNILRCASPHTLVLCDELTKGTEVVSATSIFVTAILELVCKGAKFLFTTHLQDVSKLDVVRQCSKVAICHLSISVQPDKSIVFQRKLMPGPCSELYGLEVAGAVGLPAEFVRNAFGIRNTILKQRGRVVDTKRSRYNAKKILDACEVCGYQPMTKRDIPLDTHHIGFQCTADANGMIEHFHKNVKSNLVCLCKECHQRVHAGDIVIEGYLATTNGVKLSFTMDN